MKKRLRDATLGFATLFLVSHFTSQSLQETSRGLSVVHDEMTILESILQLSAPMARTPASDEAVPFENLVSPPSRTKDTPTDVPVDIENFDENTTVLAMISFGNATKQNHVQRAIRSARARGEWNGRVVVITDASHNYHDLVNEDPLVHLITPRQQDWENTPSYRSEKLKFKRFKTFLIDYITADPKLRDVAHILYLDVDIIVGKPIVSWMKDRWSRGRKRRLRASKDTSSIYMFGTGNGGRTAHSGVILLHTKLSNGCLKKWREKMDRRGMTVSRDQFMLRMMKREGAAKTGCAITTWTKTELVFPLQKDFIERRFAQFVHITNTYHAGQTDARIQKEYLEEALNLTDHERRDPNSLANIPDGF